MATFENFYDLNPVAQIDQNKWTVQDPELMIQFRNQPVIYTPLIDWTDESQTQNGAQTTIHTEMLEGDVAIDPIPMTANYIGVTVGVDSRSRQLTSTRYGDKVQLHKSQNMFQQWRFSGGRDWRPLLRGILATNVIRKHEILSRNAYLMGPKAFWTFAGGGTSFSDIGNTDTFNPDVVLEWNLRIGQTGTPVIPGDQANAKLAIMPPGAVYDFRKGLADASTNEASMWRDAQIYAGKGIRFEIGAMDNVRIQQVPNDKYGTNLNVLYNCGAITAQYGVASPINLGDGSPDPDDPTQWVDDVWAVGQKNVQHYIQLEAGADLTKFAVYDMITIHTKRTTDFGITNGVDWRSGMTIQRRIVSIDDTNKRICVDRPILFPYTNVMSATPVSGSAGNYYAFVTKARHIGFALVLGSRGGVMGKVDQGITFYEPKPVDDFDSVWRFTWDAYEGLNIWEPNLWEVHFFAVSLPKPGGIITP